MFELLDGNAVICDVRAYGFPRTVWARPGEGDTLAISYSCDGGTTFTAWAAGPVTAYTQAVFDAPITHIKGQRTGGSGTTSAFGIC